MKESSSAEHAPFSVSILLARYLRPALAFALRASFGVIWIDSLFQSASENVHDSLWSSFMAPVDEMTTIRFTFDPCASALSRVSKISFRVGGMS